LLKGVTGSRTHTTRSEDARSGGREAIMAEVQEKFEQATQAQPSETKEVNWWKRGALIVAGAFVLTIGGCSAIVVGLAALGAASDTGSASNPGHTGKVVNSDQSDESSLEGPATPANPNTKEVKVVVTSPDEPADYSAFDDRFKINDMQQISGTETFKYTLPEKDGISVDLMTEGMHAYVAIQVYEDGKLVAQDEDSSMGMATVSY
jgi:hypothetical protein